MCIQSSFIKDFSGSERCVLLDACQYSDANRDINREFEIRKIELGRSNNIK